MENCCGDVAFFKNRNSISVTAVVGYSICPGTKPDQVTAATKNAGNRNLTHPGNFVSSSLSPSSATKATAVVAAVDDGGSDSEDVDTDGCGGGNMGLMGCNTVTAS